MHDDYAGKGRLLGALTDQSAVSATNFLTIAIGAWMLALDEQSKLVYVYTAYYALVLFNASAIFSVAPMLRQDVADANAYRWKLLYTQIIIAVFGTVAFVQFFAHSGDWLGWVIAAPEMIWIFCFLAFQQLADFNRRACYVFGNIESASLLSILMLATRVALLLVVRPDDSTTFIMLLSISAIPGAVAAFARKLPVRHPHADTEVISRHFRLAKWNMLYAPLQWVCLHFPIFMVGALSGNWAAAVLASVRSVSTIANVLLELMETYVPNWMVARMKSPEGEGAQNLTAGIYKLGAGVWLSVAIVIAIFGEKILAVVLGSSYSEYWDILLLLWVGNGLYFIGRVHGVRHRIARRTSVELAGAAGGVFMLILTIPLFWSYGVYGGAWSIVVVQIGIVIIQHTYVRQLRAR